MAARADEAGRPCVEITSGALAGIAVAGGLEFLGIPYAEARRFAPPAPPRPWPGVREAGRLGPAAPQPPRPVAEFTHGPPPATDEQCLYLNVFTPAREGRRPVMVWLHGGGFAVGHGGASLYHGGWLARTADVVVVTLNYRLGSLGWLYHPSLVADRGAPAGNWGLLDQIAALEWVRANIGSFGGDPGRVTVAGQSAGALCAIDLLCAPAAAGLFVRAILQSPPLADLAQPPEAAQEWAEALSAAAGQATDPRGLRTLEPRAIVGAHERLLTQPRWRGSRGGALPTLDDPSLPLCGLAQPGVSAGVDVLVGHTAQEGTFFFNSPWRSPPSPERIGEIVARLRPDADPSEVLGTYRSRLGAHQRGDLDALVAIATDAMVAEPLARWAQARAETGATVYRYRFDHPGGGDTLRATHTAEVPLLFGTWADGGPGERLGGQAGGEEAVSRAMLDAWTRFLCGDSPGWGPVGAAPEIGVFGGGCPYRAETAMRPHFA